MKKHKKIIFILGLNVMFFSTLVHSEDGLQTPHFSFLTPHSMAISVDPFLPGARGLTAKAEFEIVMMDNWSIVIPFRAVWIDSEKFPFLFKSGYAHLDPYSYIDDIYKYFNSKDTIIEQEYTTGFGIKFYPNSKPLQNGFYIKPILTFGYASLAYSHTKIDISLKAPYIGKIDVDLKNNEYISTIDNPAKCFVLVPEILVGYNMTFASHFLISLEVGAKYRLFTHQDFVKYVPRLTGIEPSLSFMIGYTW